MLPGEVSDEFHRKLSLVEETRGRTMAKAETRIRGTQTMWMATLTELW